MGPRPFPFHPLPQTNEETMTKQEDDRAAQVRELGQMQKDLISELQEMVAQDNYPPGMAEVFVQMILRCDHPDSAVVVRWIALMDPHTWGQA